MQFGVVRQDNDKRQAGQPTDRRNKKLLCADRNFLPPPTPEKKSAYVKRGKGRTAWRHHLRYPDTGKQHCWLWVSQTTTAQLSSGAHLTFPGKNQKPTAGHVFSFLFFFLKLNSFEIFLFLFFVFVLCDMFRLV